MTPPSTLAGLSILVVEDHRDNCELLETFLTYVGATVRTATNADEGLALFQAAPPAVVLADIAMPEHDGLWLLGQIRSLPGGSRVPVLAVTGRTLSHERQELREAGFNALVIKPIADWDGLAEMILATTGPSGPATF